MRTTTAIAMLRHLSRMLVAVMSLLLGIAVAAKAQDELQELDRRIVELARSGKRAEATALAQQALSVAEQRLGVPHPLVAQRLDNLGLLLRIQRLFADAEPVFKRSLSMREQIFGAGDPEICQSLNNLAVLYEMQNRLDDVEVLLTRSLAIRERTFGPEHPSVGQSLHELAKIYRDQGRAVEAQALFDRAVGLLGPGHPASILLLIAHGKFEQVAQLLGLNVPDGNRDAAVAAVDRTFFGKVDAVRWTGSAVEDGPDPQRLLVRGEATHRNKIWQPFEVDMIRDAGSWKMLRIRPLPLPWM